MTTLSKSQIDRLGDRLRKGLTSESDLRLLDDYRRSFGEVYETVVGTIRDGLKLEPTGRPAKSTSSIIEKLRRESIRLSQIQDIAGCRIIVADALEQDDIVGSLRKAFPGSSEVDRRTNPSYGYRAVHVIAQIHGKLIEIQVRTSLQHLWAEFSEKCSDVLDASIKYGGGEQNVRRLLTKASQIVANFEEKLEKGIARQKKQLLDRGQLKEAQELIVQNREEIAQVLRDAISGLENKDDFLG